VFQGREPNGARHEKGTKKASGKRKNIQKPKPVKFSSRDPRWFFGLIGGGKIIFLDEDLELRVRFSNFLAGN
jgi:hypothetical protein